MWRLALALTDAAPELAEAPVGLEWRAPPECPSVADVRARAQRLAVAAPDALVGRAVVEARPEGGYAMSLTLGRGTEQHSAARCEALADLAALVIAVAADPVGVAVTVAPVLDALPVPQVGPSTPTSGTPAPVAPGESGAPGESFASPVPQPESPRRRDPWTGALATHGVVGLAQLPGLDAGIDLAGSLERRRFALQVRATWLAPRITAIPGQGRDAQLTSANASVLACSRWSWDRLALLGCAGVELGAVVGRPLAVDVSDTKASLWVALVGAAGLRGWVHPRLALEVGADLVFGLRRPRFALTNARDAAVGAGVGGIRGWAGLAVRLGRTR